MDTVHQSYWDNAYRSIHYSVGNDALTAWLDKVVVRKPQKVFEPGCYPGRYLAYLGKKGWQVSGVDLTPRMETDFGPWLTQEGITLGRIERGDALAYMATTEDRYDLVCSFGFIEHFWSFDEIIRLHAKITKPGGQIVIATPNFRGTVQLLLHSWLDKENLDRHVIPAMSPKTWVGQLRRAGCEVSWVGHMGGFDFWTDRKPQKLIERLAWKLVRCCGRSLKWLPQHEAYSPYCGIVATKIAE